MLAEEPAGATSIADAQKNLAAQPEVTLVGRIGVPDHEPFVPGKASFVCRKHRPKATIMGPVTMPTTAPSAAAGRPRRTWRWCNSSTIRERF